MNGEGKPAASAAAVGSNSSSSGDGASSSSGATSAGSSNYVPKEGSPAEVTDFDKKRHDFRMRHWYKNLKHIHDDKVNKEALKHCNPEFVKLGQCTTGTSSSEVPRGGRAARSALLRSCVRTTTEGNF